MQASNLPITHRPAYVRCCYCGEQFDANQEGVTYRDGRDAHEECDDANEFAKANASDFRD